MAWPPAAYLHLRAAFARGDHAAVIADGVTLLARLTAEPERWDWAPAVALLVGDSLATREHHTEAIAWLEYGLRILPGTPVARELRDGHHEHRLLAELYLLTGRWEQARVQLEWLGRPDHPLESRLASLRGRTALAAARADHDAAQWLLNTAADLARRSRSHLYRTLVDGDRAMVLASAGRFREALALADEVLPRLGATAPGPTQAWANAHAVMTATTLARRAVETAEPGVAGRLLVAASVPAQRSGRAYLGAQLDLATAALARLEGRRDVAERHLWRALDRFAALGTAPALALAHLEAARLAEASGFTQSAAALHRRALAELSVLGMTREAGEARRRLTTLAGSSG